MSDVEGEVFNHRILWSTARKLHEQAKATAAGRYFFDLPSMLLARTTVEAYANFLLSKLDPDTYAKEKEFFGSDTEKKIEHVFGIIKERLEKGRRPYQTVANLNALRDRVVHGKPEVYRFSIEHDAEEERPFMEPGALERMVSAIDCDRALEDVEAFCEELHKKIIAGADAQLRRELEPLALLGTSQRQTTHTRIKTS